MGMYAEVLQLADAAPYDDLPELDDERAAIAASRAEPDGFVPQDQRCVLEFPTFGGHSE
jgi:hypothetical protein